MKQQSSALSKHPGVQIPDLNGLCDWSSMHAVPANQSTRRFQSELELSFQSKVQLAVANILLATHAAAQTQQRCLFPRRGKTRLT